MRYGYARVSTQDQDFGAQIIKLKAAGCHNVFADKITGTSTARPQLDALRAALKPGDSVVCTRMDRLFRSLTAALSQLEQWTKDGVTFECLDQPLLNTSDMSAMGKGVRQLLLVLAELERDLIVERTREGRQRAVENGVRMGRRPKLSRRQIDHAAEAVAAGKPIKEVAAVLKVDRTTLWRQLQKTG